MNIKPVHWLLRYLNGDAFAVASFPHNYVTIGHHYGGIGEIEEERPPKEFDHFVHDKQDDLVIMLYDYERIPQAQYETLIEFGLPVISSVTNDDDELILEIS